MPQGHSVVLFLPFWSHYMCIYQVKDAHAVAQPFRQFSSVVKTSNY